MSLPDLIAAEAHYHKSCYDQFVRVNRENENEENEDPKVEVEEAYKEVLKFCLQLEYQPDIVPIKKLIDMMKIKLEKSDSILEASTRKNLRRKLERDVKSIKFINVGGVLYIYPTGISKEQLVTKCVELKDELDILKGKERKSSEERELVNSVKMVRKEIKELDDSIPWPPQPNDLVPEKFTVPPYLNLLLTTLLQVESQQLQTKTERLKMSFAQDIIYAVTQGTLSGLIFADFAGLKVFYGPRYLIPTYKLKDGGLQN